MAGCIQIDLDEFGFQSESVDEEPGRAAVPVLPSSNIHVGTFLLECVRFVA